MDLEIIGKLISEHGLPIAVAIIALAVSYYLYKDNKEALKNKDEIIKAQNERTQVFVDKMMDLQKQSIESNLKMMESNDELTKNVAINTEATRKVETLIESFGTVLLNIRRDNNGKSDFNNSDT